MTETALAALARRKLPAGGGRDQAVRHAEIRRLARAVRQVRRELDTNRRQLLVIVEDIAPGSTGRYGVGPVSVAQAVVSFSQPGRCRNEAAFRGTERHQPHPGQ